MSKQTYRLVKAKKMRSVCKKVSAKLCRFQNLQYLCNANERYGFLVQNILGYGVMVTLQILVLSFLVRDRVSQRYESQVVAFNRLTFFISDLRYISSSASSMRWDCASTYPSRWASDRQTRASEGAGAYCMTTCCITANLFSYSSCDTRLPRSDRTMGMWSNAASEEAYQP